jgi:hypothetical protein
MKFRRNKYWPRKFLGPMWLYVFFAILGLLLVIIMFVLGHKQEG